MKPIVPLLLIALWGEAGAAGDQFVDVTAAAGISFRHVSGGGGENPQKYFIETMGPGCAFWDYDGDGNLDIYAVNGYSLAGKNEPQAKDALYRNTGGGRFADLAEKAGVEAEFVGYGMGCCAGDYDSDGYQDLYVTNYGRNTLYHNNGDGTFSDRSQEAGVTAGQWSTGCAFADYDRDGDLDLYVARYVTFSLEHPGENLVPYMAMAEDKAKQSLAKKVKTYPHPSNYEGASDFLYRNEGGGRFADVTRQAGVSDPDGKGLGVVWGDYDNDGDVDLCVANDQTPNYLYRNDGGHFTDVALIAGVAYSEDGRTQAGMGVDMGDYNNDGLLDIWVTNFQGEPNALFRNDGNGFFSNTSFSSGTGRVSLPYVGWGGGFLDFDHDGFLDLFTANGHVLDNVELFDPLSTYAQASLLFRNNGRKPGGAFTFADVTSSAGKALSDKRVGRGVALGDCDNDGDVDLLISASNSPLALLRNEGSDPNHWLAVRLAGAAGAGGESGALAGGVTQLSNREAIGARVRIVCGGNAQIREVKSGASYLSQSDLRLNFGLGAHTSVDRLEVRWHSGKIEVFTAVPADRIIEIREGEGTVR